MNTLTPEKTIRIINELFLCERFEMEEIFENHKRVFPFDTTAYLRFATSNEIWDRFNDAFRNAIDECQTYAAIHGVDGFAPMPDSERIHQIAWAKRCLELFHQSYFSRSQFDF